MDKVVPNNIKNVLKDELLKLLDEWKKAMDDVIQANANFQNTALELEFRIADFRLNQRKIDPRISPATIESLETIQFKNERRNLQDLKTKSKQLEARESYLRNKISAYKIVAEV